GRGDADHLVPSLAVNVPECAKEGVFLRAGTGLNDCCRAFERHNLDSGVPELVSLPAEFAELAIDIVWAQEVSPVVGGIRCQLQDVLQPLLPFGRGAKILLQLLPV